MSPTRLTCKFAISAAMALAFSAAFSARGDVVVTSSKGALVNFPVLTSPGTAFSFDYTNTLSQFSSSPYQLVEFQFLFNAATAYSAVDFTLGNDPTIYHFPVTSGPNQVAFFYYDPAVIPHSPPPAGSADAALPDAWKTEASDGIFTGHYYLEGASGPASYSYFVTNAGYLVPAPEPGTLLLFVLPALALHCKSSRIR